MKHLFTIIYIAIVTFSLAADKPNIVFILADDMGIGDTNCYGDEKCRINTPNIDALAAEGVRFTDFHVNASICGPTRRGLMTGRYPWRFGATVNNGPWGFCGPRPNTEKYTLGKVLKKAGYNTGYVGKWHLGTTMVTKDGKKQGLTNVDYTKPLVYGPMQFGFDYSFILPGSLDMYPYAFIKDNDWQGDVSALKGWSAFNRVGPAEISFESNKVVETFYRESELFIKKQNSDTPFFLFLALTSPHTPVCPGEEWNGKSELGPYGDFVMEVDHSIARVKQALKEKGLYENTLIIFSSDHGPAPYAGNILKATPNQISLLEQQGHYPAGIYRGYKFSIYEGGLRVPFIASWPGKTPKGQICNQLIGFNDLFATFAELTNIKLQEDEAPDSISFAKLFTKPSSNGDRKDLIMQSVTSFAIRDGEWKLCLCPGSGIPANSENGKGNDPAPNAAWKKALEEFKGKPNQTDLLKAPFVQLFNLAKDPEEKNNLAFKNPRQVEKMINLFKKQIADGRSTPGPKLKNDKKIEMIPLKDRRLPEFVRNLFTH